MRALPPHGCCPPPSGRLLINRVALPQARAARPAPQRRPQPAPPTPLAWNCTMGCRLWIASCTSLLHRLMTSALAPARWMAPASTAPDTTALLSTTACGWWRNGKQHETGADCFVRQAQASQPLPWQRPPPPPPQPAGLPAPSNTDAARLLEVALNLQQHLVVDDAAEHADGVGAVQVVGAVHVLHEGAARRCVWGAAGQQEVGASNMCSVCNRRQEAC